MDGPQQSTRLWQGWTALRTSISQFMSTCENAKAIAYSVKPPKLNVQNTYKKMAYKVLFELSPRCYAMNSAGAGPVLSKFTLLAAYALRMSILTKSIRYRMGPYFPVSVPMLSVVVDIFTLVVVTVCGSIITDFSTMRTIYKQGYTLWLLLDTFLINRLLGLEHIIFSICALYIYCICALIFNQVQHLLTTGLLHNISQVWCSSIYC